MDNFNVSLILAATINFWILFLIFKHFLWERLANMIEEYRKNIENSKNADAIAKDKINKADEKSLEILKKAKVKASEIEKSAKEMAKYNTKIEKENAEREAEYIIKHAKAQIEKEKLQVQNEIKANTLDLAIQLNSRIFFKKSANKEFLEKEFELINK